MGFLFFASNARAASKSSRVIDCNVLAGAEEARDADHVRGHPAMTPKEHLVDLADVLTVRRGAVAPRTSDARIHSLRLWPPNSTLLNQEPSTSPITSICLGDSGAASDRVQAANPPLVLNLRFARGARTSGSGTFRAAAG